MNTDTLVIVLPGFLPDKQLAKQLLPAINDASNPALLHTLNSAKLFQTLSLRDQENSPWEVDLLTRAGLQSSASFLYTQALASCYIAQPAPTKAYVIGHLSSLQIDTQQARLQPDTHNHITLEESQDLLKSIVPLLDAYGCQIQLLTPKTWLFSFDQDPISIKLPSFDWIQGKNVNHFVQANKLTKTWQQLHNEIQMVWHARSEDQPNTHAINFIWPESAHPDWSPKAWSQRLIGTPDVLSTLGKHLGVEHLAHPSMMTYQPLNLKASDYIVDLSLWHHYQQEDWYQWQQDLMSLSSTLFEPVNQSLAQGRTDCVEWVLGNHEQQITLRQKKPTWFTNLVKQDWRKWWLGQK